MNATSINSIYDGYRRLQADRQNRSDAINNAIIERDRKINALREELQWARRCMVVVIVILLTAIGCELWRMGLCL